jgi:Holliday junction resolvasome RuvABC endonuclease subunit
MGSNPSILGLDAGFVNIGFAVAELPDDPTDKPILVELGVSSAPLPSAKERKRKGMPVALQNVLRVRKQAQFLAALCKKYNPVATFVEYPHGGAKSAIAARSMGAAMALMATALKILLPNIPSTVFTPSDIKEIVGGAFKTSKEQVAQKVIDFWPSVSTWPGFKLNGEGLKVKQDATDAGAVVIAAMTTDVYKSLFAGRR